jgi:hypothetical protein
MNKQTNQHDIIDIDSFEDGISIWQMLPSGTNKGTGLSLLKTHVDAVLNGRAKLKSLLITGRSKAQLVLTANAFLRGLGLENINVTDAALLQSVFELHIFFCGEAYDGYVITNIEKTIPSIKSFFCGLLRKQQLKPYNYVEKKHDIFDVSGPVIMTATNTKKVVESVWDSIQYKVPLEEYSSDELSLVALQFLKYSNIDYESEAVLENIVMHGNSEFDKVITFLRLCIAVMQADATTLLKKEHVTKAARLSKLPTLDDDFEDTIPF